ncbi:MAG TPA: dihydroorotate dehydrogenase-like protein, partial [Actinomycetota bacterium]|nr:dihydroorotate dehydrogenase-like protein [Actinomycetota bacterium]
IVAAGAGALVLPSLFEEEIVHEEVSLQDALQAGTEHFAEALDYYPGSVEDFPSIADRYLEKVAAIKKRVEVPVIASLNGTSPGGWVRYARLLQEAGADALELNLYRVAADPHRKGSEVERDDVTLVQEVCSSVSLPVAVKLSPYYSSMAHLGPSMTVAGAAGLVLFNRFYQPDLDVDSREVAVKLELSHPAEIRLPLRWMAILRPLVGDTASLALTSGVHSGRDVAKALLVGADVAMTTSALLIHGPEHLKVMHMELLDWLGEHAYSSVDQLRGSVSYKTTDDPSAFERANYIRTLHSWTAPSNRTPASPSS